MKQSFTCLPMIMLVLFASLGCNPNQNPKDKSIALSNIDSASSPSVCAEIAAWDSMRKQAPIVTHLFENTGNTFTFEHSGDHDTLIHLYFAYNTIEQQAYFYVVNVSSEGEQYPGSRIQLSSVTQVLDTALLDSTLLGNKRAISPAEALERVNNWLSPAIRNQWINSNFQNGVDSAIFQVFIIRAADLAAGQEHTGYLALKSASGPTGTYAMDLIIVSNGINGGQLQSIEDMVHSVPPFTLTLNKGDFGLLNACD